MSWRYIVALGLAGCGEHVGIGSHRLGASVETAGCRVDGAVLCETFDSPHAGGRGGELDESIWSVSRWSYLVTQWWARTPASTQNNRLFSATFCGAAFSDVLPTGDVRVCSGASGSTEIHEVVNDAGTSGLNSMRLRQPFDFTGRTGVVAWDVDAKANPYSLGHGWWTEVWITADPAPLPSITDYGAIIAPPREAVVVGFRAGADCPEDGPTWMNGVDMVTLVRDYAVLRNYLYWDFDGGVTDDRCFRTQDGALNHVELRISREHLEVWVSDFDNPDSLRLRATVSNLDLGFSRGYVHLQHVQRESEKDGAPGCLSGDATQCVTSSQTYRWDNIAFDGPVLPTPRAYDVPDNDEPGLEGTTLLGYELDADARGFTLRGVDLTGAVGASLNLAIWMSAGQALEYRFNAGAWRTFVLDAGAQPASALLRSLSIPVLLGDLTSGDNALELRVPAPGGLESVGAIDLTLEL